MPTEKPMKVQWQQIDGRTVPFTLPQYWDEDKQDWVISGTENPLPTQLTGSNGEEQLYERFLFDGTQDLNERSRVVNVPKWAKGAVVFIRILGATGEYSEGNGLRVKVHQVIQGGRTLGAPIYEQETHNNRGTLMFYLYPGIESTDVDSMDLSQEGVKIVSSSFPIFNQLLVRLYMDGNPDDDEGYDIDGKVIWLG